MMWFGVSEELLEAKREIHTPRQLAALDKWLDSYL